MRAYTCTLCNKEFVPKWDEAELLLELQAAIGDSATLDNCNFICYTCWHTTEQPYESLKALRMPLVIESQHDLPEIEWTAIGAALFWGFRSAIWRMWDRMWYNESNDEHITL